MNKWMYTIIMTFAIAVLLSVTNGRFAPVLQVDATPKPTATPTPTGTSTQTISAKALTNYECEPGNQWQFVITQIDTQADAPANMTVFWSGVSESVALSSFTGKTAHYITTDHLDVSVTSATATIYSSWSGEFNLSDGPCDIQSPTNTPTPTQQPTATPTQGVTPTPSTDPCANNACITATPTVTDTPTPTPTNAPTATPTPGPTATPTPGTSGCTNNCGSSNNTPTQAVLGASTMADTGTFTENMMNIFMTLGMISLIAGATKYAKEKSK